MYFSQSLEIKLVRRLIFERVWKMKFFKGFIVFILIAIIVGGVGYIGYSFFSMSGTDHEVTTNSTQNQQTAGTNANSGTGQTQQGTQHGSDTTQAKQNESTQQGNNQIALNQSNIILQNKDKLVKSIALINESRRLLSVDPYAPNSSNSGNMSGMNTTQPQQQTANASTPPVQGNTPAATNPSNNTTINIYPQNNNPATQSIPQSNAMPNMGTSYDANKMEQLHSGLYKIAVGTALLDQLQNELVYQAEYATVNSQNQVTYYSNQYNLTVQNKNKISQALTYVNEAANLVNINPYVSANGLVYDKDRMNQIHQSILKLAEGVAALNQLGDDFTKQSILLSSAVQNYINSANVATQQMNQGTMSMGLFGGLFDNINMTTVVNIIIILFVVGLIAGVLGFIFSLLKPRTQKTAIKDEEVV